MRQWLEGIGMGEYINTFIQHNISTGGDLMKLQKSDLQVIMYGRFPPHSRRGCGLCCQERYSRNLWLQALSLAALEWPHFRGPD